MNTDYPCLITESSVVLQKGGRLLTASVGHVNFGKIVEMLKAKRYNNIERLFSVKETLEKCFNVTIKNNKEVFYKGEQLHNTLTEKILGCLRQGLPHKGWVNFLNKLMENPIALCRNQLFDYVKNYGLPIDEQGFVYAWKAVNENLWDKHTGKTFQYKVGAIIHEKRDLCNNNPKVACGSGVHCGEYSYVKNFGGGDGDRFVLVRFSPKDVISCPEDSSWQKLRVCKLRVMREVDREEIFPLGDRNMGKKGKLPKSKFKRNKLGQFSKK